MEGSYRRFDETYGSDHAARIVWLRGQDIGPLGHADELRARRGLNVLRVFGSKSNFRRSERVLSDKSPNWPLIGPIATLKLQDPCARTHESCILGTTLLRYKSSLEDHNGTFKGHIRH